MTKIELIISHTGDNLSRFRFAILGGDYRYKLIFDSLASDGYTVRAYANSFISPCVSGISELLEDTDVIIGSIPTSKDDETLYLPDVPSVTLKSFFENMYKNNIGIYIGGVISPKVKNLALKCNIKAYDFFACEDVAVYNAIPTAEGAIATAVEESDITLFGNPVLVLGYGRVGKVLANMLKGMGADTYSTYRSEETAAFIKAFGIKGIPLYELKSRIGEFSFIFNTIPAEILSRDVLKKANKRCLIIDLAQAPGGTDFGFARDLNLKALYCPGLPGRTAPKTAAEILKTAVLNIALTG